MIEVFFFSESLANQLSPKSWKMTPSPSWHCNGTRTSQNRRLATAPLCLLDKLPSLKLTAKTPKKEISNSNLQVRAVSFRKGNLFLFFTPMIRSTQKMKGVSPNWALRRNVTRNLGVLVLFLDFMDLSHLSNCAKSIFGFGFIFWFDSKTPWRTYEARPTFFGGMWQLMIFVFSALALAVWSQCCNLKRDDNPRAWTPFLQLNRTLILRDPCFLWGVKNCSKRFLGECCVRPQ